MDMKSTFNKEIVCDQQKNGAFAIRFMASRGSGHDFSSGKLVFIGAVLFIFGIPLIALFGFGLLPMALGIGMFIKAFIYRYKPYELLVIPREGITWGPNRLPFSDVVKIGIQTLQGNRGGPRKTGSMVSESSYVYATAGGKEIQLTLNMPTARAEAVRDAIYQYADYSLA